VNLVTMSIARLLSTSNLEQGRNLHNIKVLDMRYYETSITVKYYLCIGSA
jgi:hypothetical protein